MEWNSENYPKKNVNTSPNTIHSFYNLLLHLFLLILKKFQKVEEKEGERKEMVIESCGRENQNGEGERKHLLKKLKAEEFPSLWTHMNNKFLNIKIPQIG